MSNIRPYLRKLWLADRDGGCNPDVMVFRPTKEIMSEFVYYMLRRQTFIGYVMNDVKGMKMLCGNKDNIIRFHQFNSRLLRKFQPKKPNPSSTAVQNASRLFWIST